MRYFTCSLLMISTILKAQEPKLVLPTGHNNIISGVTTSPDEKKIISYSLDKTIKIWDTKSGLLLADCIGHTETINAIDVSPDGSRILSGSSDRTIKIWSLINGQLLNTLQESSPIQLVRYNPDGRTFISVTYWDTAINIWDVNKLEKIKILKGHKDNIKSAVYNKTGDKLITTGGWDKTPILWNFSDTIKMIRLEGHTSGVENAFFSPDEKKVVTYDLSGVIKIWKTENGEILHTLVVDTNSTYSIKSLSFNTQGNRLIVAMDEYTVVEWDVEKGRLVFAIDGLSDKPRSAYYDREEKNILINISDSGTILYNKKSKKIIPAFSGNHWFSQFSTSKKLILAPILATQQVQVYNAQNLVLLSVLKGNCEDFSYAKIDLSDGSIVISKRGLVKNFDLQKDAIKNFIPPPCDDWSGPRFSKDNSMFIVFGYSNGYPANERAISIYSASTGKLINQFISADLYKKSQISLNGNYILIIDDNIRENPKIKIYDLKNGTLINVLSEELMGDGSISEIGSLIITRSGKIYDYITNKLISTITNRFGDIDNVYFSPNNKHVVLVSRFHSEADIFDVESGLISYRSSLQKSHISNIDFSEDNNYMLCLTYDSIVTIYKRTDGKEIETIKLLIKDPRDAHFFGKKNFIAFSTENKYVVWDVWNNRLVKSITAQSPLSEEFFYDQKQHIILSSNNEIEYHNTEKNKKEFTLFFIDSIGYLKLIPEKYYKTTPAASKLLHYVTDNLNIITFDQLDIKYNRPDKVLEAVGSTDTALINSYKKAYLKRIKKLGIDTTSFKEGFTIPEADFKNRDAVEYEQKSKQLKLHITGKSTETLDRFNVWVNEVPLYGQKGINIRYKNKKDIDTTLSVILSEGDNSIETSITDVNGIESYRQPLFVKYSPEKKQPSKTYFIGIGINRFADNMNNLSWSVKDIRDLAIKFASKNAVIDTLFDENVTTEKIIALKNKLLQTNEEDKVIISYSGHGLLSKEYDYFLSTYNINFQKPEQNGLPYEELENLLDGIKARKKLLLIDACHSGEVDKEEMKNYEDSKDSRKKEGVKGLIIAPKDSTKIGMRNSFEMMQELFVNVGRGTGATVISAASGTQFALEKGDLRNGVFTYCLLEAMNTNSTLKVSDLKKVVTDKVPQLTAGLQKPTFRSETQQFDWELW